MRPQGNSALLGFVLRACPATMHLLARNFVSLWNPTAARSGNDRGAFWHAGDKRIGAPGTFAVQSFTATPRYRQAEACSIKLLGRGLACSLLHSVVCMSESCMRLGLAGEGEVRLSNYLQADAKA
jgi:hypothetical protein